MPKGVIGVYALVFGLLSLSFVSGAEDLSLTIGTDVNGIGIDWYGATSSSSSLGYDGNDLSSPTAPANYSRLRSRVCAGAGATCLLAVDSWPASSNPRTVNLTYTVTPAQTGTLRYAWNFDQEDVYDILFIDYGTSSTYSSEVDRVNMSSASSYSVSISSATTRYAQVIVQNKLSITPANPGDGVSYSSASQSVSFQYDVVGALTPSNCSLVVSGSTVASSSSISTSTTNTLSYTLTPGSYSWYVSCQDANSLTARTTTRTLTVTAPTSSTTTTTSTTSSSAVASSSATEASIVAQDRRKISFLEVPEGLSFSVFLDVPTTRTFTVKNIRSVPITLSLRSEKIDDFISFDESVVLQPGEERAITVTIKALREGLLTGRLVLSDGTSFAFIPLVLNIRTENFLFDTQIVLDQETRHLTQGDALRTQINLLQVGPQQKVDVVANYIVKDFSGKIYLQESETFYVLDGKEYIKSFDTSQLPPGDYILGLELTYPGAFATSSAQFKVLSASPLGNFGIIWLFLGGLIVAGASVIGFLLWRRHVLYGRLHRR